MEDPALALVYYVVFVFSVTLHEAAHAWAALRGGDPTAYHGGQVSLSPLPHMRREPIGMVLLPILTVIVSGWPFGYASAPYDPAWAARYPRRAAWMALAGPAANLAIMAVAALVLRVGLGRGVFLPPESVFFSQIVVSNSSDLASAGGMLLSVLFSMNLLLAVLNLIPVPPLDGAGALGLVLPEDTARRYQDFVTGSGLGIIGIVIAWQLVDEIFHPIFLLLVNWLHPASHYG
jgi:Zn-dependent protease